MKILIFGGSGMLGNMLTEFFSTDSQLKVFTTLRSKKDSHLFSDEKTITTIPNVNALNEQSVIRALEHSQPDVIINCIGLIKQQITTISTSEAIKINSLFPHQLASYARILKSRLIHISTDCVFNGEKGAYTDSESPNANDLYGQTKALGEVDDNQAITLRTSIIGHEPAGRASLLEWFLSQEGQISGFSNAIFSGLTTYELSKVILNHVIANKDITGIYNVSSHAISKHDLLNIINEIYGKGIEIVKSEHPIIDRSLDSTAFKLTTNYSAPSWAKMISEMRDNWIKRSRQS